MQDCKSAQRLFDAYIDNELLSSEVAAVQTHLESCSDCSALLNELLYLKEGLGSLPREEAPPHLKARILKQLKEERKSRPSFGRGLRWKPLAVGALAAAFLLVAFLGHELFFPYEPMYATILMDHYHQLSPSEKTDMMSKDPEALWAWLNKHAPFRVPSSLVMRKKLSLVGGRVAKMNGEEIVSIRYEASNEEATFHVMQKQVRMPSSAKKEMVEGTPIFIDRYRGYNIVMWKEGGLQICAVSALNKDSLVAMVMDAHHLKPMKI